MPFLQTFLSFLTLEREVLEVRGWLGTTLKSAMYSQNDKVQSD